MAWHGMAGRSRTPHWQLFEIRRRRRAKQNEIRETRLRIRRDAIQVMLASGQSSSNYSMRESKERATVLGFISSAESPRLCDSSHCGGICGCHCHCKTSWFLAPYGPCFERSKWSVGPAAGTVFSLLQGRHPALHTLHSVFKYC